MRYRDTASTGRDVIRKRGVRISISNNRKELRMKRSLKAGLGLSMLVALIVAAFGVMSASATTSGHFTSDSAGETKLIPTEATGTTHTTSLSAFGLTVTCHNVTYTAANMKTATTQEITVTPTYLGCTSGENPAHVRMNGCHYIFTSRTAPGHGTPHFLCPVGKKAEVEITGSNCIMKFGAQTPTSGGATYDTIEMAGKHALTVNVTAEGIHAEAHGGICVFFPTNTTTAKLTGSVTVRGENPATGAAVGITAT
jgi:hypothetical protein